MNLEQLTQRLEALEAREAIRDLKHRYLASCDAKDVAGFRGCFADGKVAIDYGSVGQFDAADDLAAVFEQMACHPHMLEWHLSSNPQIEVTGPATARGGWSLHYQLVNTQDGTLTQLGGVYEDAYVKTSQGWRIAATRFVARSCVVLKLNEDGVKTVFAGAPQTA